MGTLIASTSRLTEAVGGGMALFFIAGLTLSIAALGLLYMTSALIVLERFARVARTGGYAFAAVLGIAALAAGLALRESDSGLLAASRLGGEEGSAAGRFALWWLAASVLGCVGTIGVRAALGRLSSETFSLVATVFAGLCLGQMLGGAGGALQVLAPVGGVLLLLLVLTLLGGRGHRAFGAVERGLMLLAASLSLGLVPALGPGVLGQAAVALGEAGLVLLALVLSLGLLPLALAGLLDMRGSAEWFIAVRYLFAQRRQVFISAITAICVVGIAAGVWLLVVVLSVMNGFEQTWRNEILGDRAHFTLQRRGGSFGDYDRVLETVRGTEGVIGASPYLDADAMVRGPRDAIFSVRVRGIDPVLVQGVTRLGDEMIEGSIEALAEPPPVDLPDPEDETGEAGGAPEDGIVIGSQLAGSLALGVGDTLLVVSPFGGPPTPMGPAPRLQRFRVVGVYRSSFYQYDEVYTYVNLPVAQSFRRAGPVIDGIEGLTADYYRSAQVGARVTAGLPAEFFTRDWKEYFPAFFQALKTERIMMFVLLTMVMVVAAFVIVATLIMMIIEKTGDISILKAMGAEDGVIERIFALEGTLIGLVGTFLGVLAGLAVTHRLGWIQHRLEALSGADALPSSVYQFSSLPSRIDPVQIGVVVLIALVLSLGATLLPSRQGARLDPAEGLRHE